MAGGHAPALAPARRASLFDLVMETMMAKLDDEDRDRLGDRAFAFPEQRKEPLENASHVRNAVARFNQVKNVTDAERDAAWKRIEAAAKTHGVAITERS